MSISSFIGYKILLRSMLASVVPMSLYTLGYLTTVLLVHTSVGYFNKWAWITIACFSLLWPLQHLMIWMLFQPFYSCIRKGLRQRAPKKLKNGKEEPLLPFAKRGNFLPVRDEIAYKIDQITSGRVPTDINGTYLKNGANAQFNNDDTLHDHWFAGDGMLHAFQLRRGELFYCNRYVRTNVYEKERKVGKKIYANLGDMTGNGIYLIIMDDILMKIGYLSPLPPLQQAQANTALIQHSQRTFAVVEVDLPFWVKVEGNGDAGGPSDLEIQSKGYDNFDGQLKHACSAHSKVDRRTKEFFVFAASIDRPVAHYSVFGGDRRLLRSYEVPLLSVRSIHDWLMTEKYAVVPDLPVELDIMDGIKNKRFALQYNKRGLARYGIFPRDSKDGKDIKWFEVDTHYCFHFAAAWNSVNQQGEEIVSVFGVTHEDFTLEFQNREHLISNKDEVQKFERFDFNLSTMQSKRTTLLENMQLEFPTINLEYMGYQARYCYIGCRVPDDPWPTDELELDNMFYTGFIKFDLLEGKIIKIVKFGETHCGDEICYHQRDGSDPLRDEDDGYLMTCVYNWKTKQSQMVMWDARTLEPVVEAELKERVPFGFHGTFVHEKDY